MAKSFDHLRDGMSADSRARSEERTKEMVEETDCTCDHTEHEPCPYCVDAEMKELRLNLRVSQESVSEMTQLATEKALEIAALEKTIDGLEATTEAYQNLHHATTGQMTKADYDGNIVVTRCDTISAHEPCDHCYYQHTLLTILHTERLPSLMIKIQGLDERVLEYSTLFELQHKRILQATEHWQKHTGKKQTWPDLGDLLEFLCDRIDEQGEAILNANELVANLTMALDDGAVEQIEVLHEHVTGLQCAIEDHKNKLRMIEGLCKEGS